MAKQSKYTKHVKRKLWLLRTVYWVLLLLPIIFYVCKALGDEGVIVEKKVALVGSVVAALIVVAFNILAQKHLSSPLWLVSLGLFVAIKNVLLPLILIVAITSILGDFFFNPTIEKLKIELISNKTIDKRRE